MKYKDYYKVLGLEQDATQGAIKRGYRQLARKYHPDVNTARGAEDRFKEISEAYEVLKDPKKRAAYDELGANWQSGQEFKRPQNWGSAFDSGGRPFSAQGSSGFSDFFESLFAQRMRGTKPEGAANRLRRGKDHSSNAQINIEDAYHGTTQILSLRKRNLDPAGKTQTSTQRLSVRIPKGIQEGQKIRLAGQGDPGTGNAPAGDLYLKINFKQHPFYRVEGKDVYLDFPVTPWEIILGATLETPTPEGPVRLKIPPDSKQGQKLRLKGRGIPAKIKGDFYVVLKIALPPAGSDKAKEAYRQMAHDLPLNPRKHFGL